MTQPIWSNRNDIHRYIIGHLRIRHREVLEQLCVCADTISEDFARQLCRDLGIWIDSEYINWLHVVRFLEQRKLAEGMK